MDKSWTIMSQEATPYCELEKYELQRRAKEGIPEPAKKKDIFAEQIKKEEDWINSELERLAQTEVRAGLRDSGRVISDENEEGKAAIFEHVKRHFQSGLSKITSLEVELLSLKRLGKYLDEEVNRDATQTWSNRFRGVDELIKQVKARIPELFNSGKINVDPRFPIERCSQVDGRWCDMWLSSALKSKPIPFENSKYVDDLKKFHRDFFLPQLKKEQDAKKIEETPAPPVESAPPPVDPGISPALMHEFYTMGNEERTQPDPGLTLRGRIQSKIMGGGR
jgi:hypothetical protein